MGGSATKTEAVITVSRTRTRAKAPAPNMSDPTDAQRAYLETLRSGYVEQRKAALDELRQIVQDMDFAKELSAKASKGSNILQVSHARLLAEATPEEEKELTAMIAKKLVDAGLNSSEDPNAAENFFCIEWTRCGVWVTAKEHVVEKASACV